MFLMRILFHNTAMSHKLLNFADFSILHSNGKNGQNCITSKNDQTYWGKQLIVVENICFLS